MYNNKIASRNSMPQNSIQKITWTVSSMQSQFNQVPWLELHANILFSLVLFGIIGGFDR